ncbi:platelet endothelial aggregation receptor 1 [Fusarium pseudoanthophilum]|uniref:Platelet endothelial aggregation receptor 1 n=1 Tax=Fusarium pseudoanthophilum TaxID=48495 RepID=A0A8H5NU19_9HYPO|nr:platelet endothelial aggregation receptor 1 [Fusarium pseudoanthophilum]
MLFYQIAPLALWVGRGAASGHQLFHDKFQLDELPNMVSLADAKLKDIVLPDSLSDFTEWIGGIAEPQAFGLQPRQQQCANAGYYPCSSGLGCCPSGSTCISTGCCRGNTKECGSGRCYDPSSQICCSSGTACLKSQTCVNGGCCSRGEAKCGSSGCYNPDTSVCCGGIGRNCPKGYDCMPGGGCCPSGQKRCGNSKCYNPKTTTCCTGSGTVWPCPKSSDCCSTGFCANPSTQRCCKNGSCLKGTTCCEKECCKSIGYCGSDGYCKPCPAATSTIKSTDTVTTTKMKTVRVTTDIEPDTGNAPEFTCVPMTATNDEGATLELDEGCTLHYEPPEATTTDDSAARLRRDAATAPAQVHKPLARQLSCTPYTIYTTTEWETETETETGTKTVTVQGEDATFSCPEMEVTNDVGDTLALDAECVLSFTPAETTSSEEGASAQDRPTSVPAGTGESTTTMTATAGSGGSNGNSGSVEKASLSLMLSFAGIAMLMLTV